MKEEKNHVYYYIICFILLIVFGWFLYVAVGSLSIYQGILSYMFIVFCLFCIIMCSITFAVHNKFKIVNLFMVTYAIGITSVCLFATDKVQDDFINSRYNEIDKKMIKSYSGIKKTPIYKDFLINKKNHDTKNLYNYMRNINNYLSIDSEKLMQIKMFYDINKNKDIHFNLDKVFEDGIVSINEYKQLIDTVEYKQFKTVVYQIPLKQLGSDYNN